MNEYAQAIFEEAGHDLDRAIELLHSRTMDHLLFSIVPFERTVLVHSRTLRDLIGIDAEYALGMATYPAVRKHPLQGRAELRELIESMKQ
jgi:hypothetical protein